jgi:CheY-like chemotaxis protein
VTTACVLLVEDDDDLRDSLGAFLESEGHAVVTAANGREALDKLGTTEAPCLILLDLFMPVMDGYEFLQCLRSTTPTPPPVIVLSAAPPASAQLRAALALAQSFIRKPLDLDTVLRAVDDHCRKT